MVVGLWRRWTEGARRLRQRPHWERFAGAGWANDILNVATTDRHHAKQGRSIGRWVLRDGGEELVVYLKRHYQLPRWRGLLAWLWPGANWSPGFTEWDNLEQLRAEGFPVPEVAAAGQFLLPGGRLQGFLAVEELTGMLPLHEAIPLASRRLNARAFARWKRGLVGALAALVRALHDGGYFHKDLYLCHFYLAEADTGGVPGEWAGRLVMIDLHRLGRHRWTAWWWRGKDLGQLLYSSAVEGVTDRDRWRFWRLYAGGRRRAWLRWVARTRARNYAERHRERARAA